LNSTYCIPQLEEYPEILEDLYKFINSYNDVDNNLVDVILEYCSNNSYSPELISDVVSSDSSFKLALEINCISNGVFRPEHKIKSEAPEIDQWDS